MRRAVIVPAQAVRIVIATRPVDFRKGHDGLAAVVEHELGLDPHSGIVAVFRSKRGDRIKSRPPRRGGCWSGTATVSSWSTSGSSRGASPGRRSGTA